MYTLESRFYDRATRFLKTPSVKDQLKLAAAIDATRTGNFELVNIKTLRGKVRELIVGRYRIVFFTTTDKIHIVSGFIKKSAKTPKHEIDYAETIYKMLS